MSTGEPWRRQRRFCLRNLKDFGFGKSSIEDLILDEFKELVSQLRSDNVPKNQTTVVSLDQSLNAATSNVIWWMMACKSQK
jgi:hypothetical protein